MQKVYADCIADALHRLNRYCEALR
jgi:hypothetical protein